MLDDKRRRYFTAAEVAEPFRLSRSTVYDMVGRRVIRAHKIGSAIRIPREEIERLERDTAP